MKLVKIRDNSVNCKVQGAKKILDGILSGFLLLLFKLKLWIIINFDMVVIITPYYVVLFLRWF